MAEGAPLLREYRVYSPIEGSNPSLSANRMASKYFYFVKKCMVTRYAPVAQLDRVPDYESGGRRFESSRARHLFMLTAFMVNRI